MKYYYWSNSADAVIDQYNLSEKDRTRAIELINNSMKQLEYEWNRVYYCAHHYCAQVERESLPKA